MLLDRALVTHHPRRPVHAERADEKTVRAEGGDELPLVRRTLQHAHEIPDDPDVLELLVVLVGPHVGDGDERDALLGGRQQGLRRGVGLLDGVRPVLDACIPLEGLVVPAGDVARGDDVLRAERPAGGVADHAVLEGETRAFQPASLGEDADRHDHEVGWEHGPVRELDSLHAIGTHQPLHRRRHHHLDTVLPMEPDGPLAHRRAEDALHRPGEELDDGYRQIEDTAGRCDLGADEAGADHDGTRAACRALRAVRGSPRRCAGRINACHRLGSRQRPAGRTGRDDKAVKVHSRTVVERHLATLQVHRHGSAAEEEGRVEALRHLQAGSLVLPCAAQQLLGERRAVIRWEVGLLADQRELAAKAQPPRGLSCAETRERRAHDGDAVHR